MIFIGIDPGKTGGVAILDTKGDVVFIDSMKDVFWFKEIMKKFRKDEHFVFCEKGQVLGNKPQGAVGMYNYGYHCGELEGVLVALGMKFEMIPPVTWCKVMHLGTIGDRPKAKSMIVVKRLFQEVDLINPDAPRSVKVHEGMMDALLIAEYGRRKWVKE